MSFSVEVLLKTYVSSSGDCFFPILLVFIPDTPPLILPKLLHMSLPVTRGNFPRKHLPITGWFEQTVVHASFSFCWHIFTVSSIIIWDDSGFVQFKTLLAACHFWLATYGDGNVSHRVDGPLKGLEGSGGADPLFLKARLSVQGSIFMVHQRSTCRALQRTGFKPCYVLIHVSQGVCVYTCMCMWIYSCWWCWTTTPVFCLFWLM